MASLVDGSLAAAGLDADPAFGPWFARMMRYACGPGDVERIDRIWFETDASPVVDLIQAPTAVYHRVGWDAADIDEARRHAGRIRGAEVIAVEGSGFAPWSSGGDAVGRAVADFVNKVHEEEARYDRTLATVLFTDIAGSTDRLTASGDAEWVDTIADHHRRVRAVLARYRGREIDTAGDGFFATFDGPARAVIAALTIVEALKEVGIDVRAGLHTGEVVMHDSGVSGLAVHVGSRVSSRAQAGEVLVTRTVVDLVAGSGLAFADTGEHELKGVPGVWRLFRASRS
jgi:class 3 adenylate cyclase